MKSTPYRVLSRIAVSGVIASAMTLSGVAAASAASKAPAAPKQIVIGTLYASSGSFAQSSLPQYAGLKFWVNQMNQSGGAYVKAFHKKIPLKLVAYNDQSSSTTAATLYNQLITQNKVNILVSDFGSVLTSVAVPIAQEHKMLLIDPTGTGDSFFSKTNPYIALTSLPTSGVWPTTLANYLIDKHYKRIAVIYDQNDFDQSQATTLTNKLKTAHITPVYNNSVPTSTSNYPVLVHAIMSSNPDAVIELGYPTNDIPFLQSVSASGAKFNMLFTIFPGQLLSSMEQNVGVTSLAGTYTYPTPPLLVYNNVNFGLGMNAFATAFSKANNSAPNFLDVAGYNAGLVIQKALANTNGLSQLQLRQSLYTFSGKMFTLDGLFKLSPTGAQIGETLPVAQLVKSGNGLKVNVVTP